MNKHYATLQTLTWLLVVGFLLGGIGNLSAQKETLWTGGTSTDWEEVSNWNNGIPSTGDLVTILGNAPNQPTYSGNPEIDYRVQNFGTITFNNFVYNEGFIINGVGAQIINNQFFTNAGDIVFLEENGDVTNQGVFENNGIFENFGNFNNTGSADFNNNNNASFSNFNQFTNNGRITNNGHWGSYGELNNTGQFFNYGIIDNKNNFANVFGSEFSNIGSGSIQNTSGLFTVNGQFINENNITNGGELLILTASNFSNAGTLTNNGEVNNAGKTSTNDGTITNNGNWTNTDASTLENNANFDNQNTIENLTCAKWIQNATQTITGTVINEGGLIYEINGQVNVTSGQFGYEFTDLSQTAPPVPGCRAGVVVQLDENGQGSLVVDDIDKGAYGNCGAQIVNRTITPNTFTTDDLGSQIVRLYVEDDNGLSSTCDATVQVLPYVAPIVAIDDPNIDLTCPTEINLTTEAGLGTAVATWAEPFGTTNCNNGGTGGGSEPACPGLIQNEGFENELTGYFIWRNTSLTSYAGNVYAGNTAVKVGDVNGGFGQYIYDVQVGQEYTFSAYAKINSNQTEWAGMGINFYDANWQRITGESVTVNTTSYQQYSVTATAPQGTAVAIVWAWKNGDSGKLFLDELCLLGGQETCAPENIDGFVYMGEYNGSRYYCSTVHDATWQEANNAAQAAGGHLAVINDASENEYIRARVQNHSVWIGYTDESSDGNFSWVGGSSNFTQWNSGEPNGTGHASYTRLLQSNGNWTDRGAGDRYEYVMEIECGSTTPEGPQECDLVNHGPAYTGNGDRMMWIKFDNENAIEYPVVSGAKFKEFANGTALLTGRVNELNNPNKGYEYSVKLMNKRTWAEWSALGRDFKEHENGLSVDHTQWSYYEVDDSNSRFTGTGANQGQVLNISHNPSDFRYGFQVGVGANLKDNDYGLSGWYQISGSKSGRGDFNADLSNCVPTDNGGGNGELVIEQIAGPANGSEFPVGTTEVAYRATDDCGNEEICVFEVIVEGTPSELTLTCPENVTIEAAPGAAGMAYSWNEPTATSNCARGNTVEITRLGEGLANGDVFPIGITRIVYIAQDECGAVEVCEFNITVVSTPVILTVDFCPGDITASNPITWEEPVASSTCFTGLLKVEQVEGLPSGSNFPLGTTRVTYLIADECDNTEICYFDVIVTDAPCSAAGTPCDDDDDTTENDVEDGNCGCAGTPISTCADAGTPCNDDDDTTENDVEDGNCGCAGTPISTCADAGTPCNDDDDTTENDVEDGNCGCAGTPIQTGTCNLATSLGATVCDDNGTETEPNDDTYTFKLAVQNLDGGTQYFIDGTAYDYGVEYTFGPYTISNGNTNLTIVDKTNQDCIDNIIVQAPAPCTTLCDITANAANVQCNDNGTPSDPSDDTFTFDLTVTGVGNPWMFMVGTEGYNYDVVHTFGPYAISDGDVNLTVTDKDNPTCVDDIIIAAPATCSDTPVNTCNNEVLFLVGNLNFNGGDLTVKNRLEALGFNVTIVDDNASKTSDADDKGLIVISSTVSSGNIRAKYNTVNVPIIVWEAWLFDDMKMTGTGRGTNYDIYNYDDEIDITTNHPIVNGLNGLTTVFTKTQQQSWGKPAASATKIATIPGHANKTSLFAFEAGDVLVDGSTSPARRVGLFLRNNTAANFTNIGGQIFDNAVIWATGCTPVQTFSVAQPANEEVIENGSDRVSDTENVMITPVVTNVKIENTDNQLIKSIKVFPNPTTDYVNIDLNTYLEQRVEISIFDQSARLVQHVQVAAAFGTERIDLSNLTSGLYLIQVRSGDNVQMKKLVVTK